MKRFALALFVALSACAPSYNSQSIGSSIGAKIYTKGFYMPLLTGDMSFEVMNEMRVAVRKTGFPMLEVKYPTPGGATHKLEGDLVAMRDNNPKATRLEKAEIRVIDLRNGTRVARYALSAGGAFETRTAVEFANDIAGLLKRDFELE
jgi:hypothetical protein